MRLNKPDRPTLRRLSRRRLLEASLLLPVAAVTFGSGPSPATVNHGAAPRGAAPRIVVVGGGFGGATAARYLRRWAPQARVTLVLGDAPYWTCPFSNLAIVGERTVASLEVSHEALGALGIELVRQQARDFDPVRRQLELDDGQRLDWDRLVLAPGVDIRTDAIEGHGQESVKTFPHGWQAGPGTALLRRRLEAVPDGGLVAITVPEAPYRCPPGPYERASLMAWWLARHRPRARLVILDANAGFTKDALFLDAWRREHAGRVEWIGRDDGGSLRRVDPARGSLHTDFDDWRPDLACVIPPQRAGAIARRADLDGGSGWCAVDPRSFESRVHPGIHVIGDAAIASPMPKSAFAAGSQARVCAAAIAAALREAPAPEAVLMNTCYSLLTPGEAISITGSYRADADGIHPQSGTTGVSPADPDGRIRRAEAGHAQGWYASARLDAFGS